MAWQCWVEVLTPQRPNRKCWYMELMLRKDFDAISGATSLLRFKSSSSESASMSNITLPIYINNSKLLTFYWMVKCVLWFSVVYMRITARAYQSETFALPLMAGMHGRPFPPLASRSHHLHQWVIRLSPRRSAPMLFAPTHSDYLLMESLTFWGLFQMSSLQDHVLGNSFFLPCRFEENLQSRLFISRYPPLPPLDFHQAAFFWRGLLCSCSRFRSICSARDDLMLILFLARFSYLLKEKQHNFMEGVLGQQPPDGRCCRTGFCCLKTPSYHFHTLFTPHDYLSITCNYPSWWLMECLPGWFGEQFGINPEDLG